jgi:hypothetical protein
MKLTQHVHLFSNECRENVLKAHVDIHTFLDIFELKLLRNLEFSIADLFQNNNIRQSTMLGSGTASC